MYLTFPIMNLTGKIIIIALICIGAMRGYSQSDTQFWFAAPDLQQAHGDRPIQPRVYPDQCLHRCQQLTIC